jgi:hypothetical protein
VAGTKPISKAEPRKTSPGKVPAVARALPALAAIVVEVAPAISFGFPDTCKLGWGFPLTQSILISY